LSLLLVCRGGYASGNPRLTYSLFTTSPCPPGRLRPTRYLVCAPRTPPPRAPTGRTSRLLCLPVALASRLTSSPSPVPYFTQTLACSRSLPDCFADFCARVLAILQAKVGSMTWQLLSCDFSSFVAYCSCRQKLASPSLLPVRPAVVLISGRVDVDYFPVRVSSNCCPIISRTKLIGNLNSRRSFSPNFPIVKMRISFSSRVSKHRLSFAGLDS
jgi:hypothetical protein